MKILHGTWIPQSHAEFQVEGGFFLWTETDSPSQPSRKTKDPQHPRQLPNTEWSHLINTSLSFLKLKNDQSEPTLLPKFFILPSTSQSPLPSIELARYLEAGLFHSKECQNVLKSITA